MLIATPHPSKVQPKNELTYTLIKYKIVCRIKDYDKWNVGLIYNLLKFSE